MAQWVRAIDHKHRSVRSDPSIHIKRIDVATPLQPQFYERLGRRLVLAGSQPCSRFNERCHLKGLRLLFMFIYLYPTPTYIYIAHIHQHTYTHIKGNAHHP